MMHDVTASLVHSIDQFAIRREQEVPDGFLARIADKRRENSGRREGEYMHVASIPVALVESWQREGFDVYTASAREIATRLRRDNLHAFLATDKRV